ncbi:F0F1 ATP synthase subunit B' [Poseidonocella sp. HB161398]|uniref:F0F1 ATP synthase subunit B' n=1 Tax=Poseidonocella sp. HB161398 TaxID=2320855 RepID=UPI0011080B66|nr:F0F1 ATP synthase subunit B' [Poseidonocella sp. HB161398]
MANETHGTDAAGEAVVLHGQTVEHPTELQHVEAGMPQLDFTTYANQIFWLIVALAAIYWILSKIALPRIAMILAERRGTISNNIAAAEELKAQAMEAERAYEKALADAKAESARIVAEAKAEIKAELAAAVEKADAEIAAKTAESEKAIAGIREGALESVEAVAKDTAAALVSALGMSADQAAIDAAVDSRVKG